jgi:aldehyde dehydrogenase (NAD+)
MTRTLVDGMLVDGELVAAYRGRAFDNVDPATEEVIGAVPESGAADLERAIGAARRAFDGTGWSADVELRRRCLVQLRDFRI